MMKRLESVGTSMATLGGYLIIAQLLDLNTDMAMGVAFLLLGTLTAAVGIMGKGQK